MEVDAVRSQAPLALYPVDQAVPEVRTDWTEDDAGTPAAVQGTVTSVGRTDTGEVHVTLSTGDDTSVTLSFAELPTPLSPGEQILALGMIRPRGDAIVLTALSAPVRTGRVAPMRPPAALPAPQARAAAPEAEPRPEPLPSPPPAPAPAPQAPPPLRDEVLGVLQETHRREPWAVTWHTRDGYVAVLYDQLDHDQAREAVMARWRRTLRKAGLRVQVRRDLMPLGRQGPTLGPWWLQLTEGPDPLAPEEDDSPAVPHDTAHLMPLAHYRARRDRM